MNNMHSACLQIICTYSNQLNVLTTNSLLTELIGIPLTPYIVLFFLSKAHLGLLNCLRIQLMRQTTFLYFYCNSIPCKIYLKLKHKLPQSYNVLPVIICSKYHQFLLSKCNQADSNTLEPYWMKKLFLPPLLLLV